MTTLKKIIKFTISILIITRADAAYSNFLYSIEANNNIYICYRLNIKNNIIYCKYKQNYAIKCSDLNRFSIIYKNINYDLGKNKKYDCENLSELSEFIDEINKDNRRAEYYFSNDGLILKNYKTKNKNNMNFCETIEEFDNIAGNDINFTNCDSFLKSK